MEGTLEPETMYLVGRLQAAMAAAYEDWRAGANPSVAVVSQAWRLGFAIASESGVALYPTRKLEWRGRYNREDAERSERDAGRWLGERGARFWGRAGDNKFHEHSTLKEWLYDVAWVEFDREYGFDGEGRAVEDFSGHGVPAFRRLVLALESELANGPGGPKWPMWHVLTDFHKLLAARAGLRVLVWPLDKVEDGFDLLEPRLRAADGWDEGWWMLSGWAADGFRHRVYGDGERREDLEAPPPQ